jgi:hypothetical protein
MNSTFSRRRALAILTAIFISPVERVARAAQLSQPGEKPILTVTGKIGLVNKDGSAQFDRSMLEALGTVSFSTHTPWYKEPVTFEGVPLARLLNLLEVHGDTLIAVALNDYTTEIPITDAAKYEPILALKRDGEYLPVRDKGPIFIVYNYDSNSDLRSQKFYSRSAWQVTRIEIK